MSTILLFTIISFSSCKPENRYDCFKSTGKIVQEKRALPYITKIEVYDNIEVHVHQDSLPSLTVEAGENLINLIETKIVDEKLVIRNRNVCNFVRSFKPVIRVDVYLKHLTYVRFESSKNFYIGNRFRSDSLYIESEYGGGTIIADVDCRGLWCIVHAGCADFKATGKSDYLYLWNVGVGEQHFEKLEASDAYIEQRGNGDCHIRTSKSIRCEIRHNGNVYSYGNPATVIENSQSKGKLIRVQ